MRECHPSAILVKASSAIAAARVLFDLPASASRSPGVRVTSALHVSAANVVKVHGVTRGTIRKCLSHRQSLSIRTIIVVPRRTKEAHRRQEKQPGQDRKNHEPPKVQPRRETLRQMIELHFHGALTGFKKGTRFRAVRTRSGAPKLRPRRWREPR